MVEQSMMTRWPISVVAGFLILVAGFASNPALATESQGAFDVPPMAFRQLGPDQGLSQSTVHSIFQDRYGFMWFGTENGLNRYDGVSVRTYYRDAQIDGSIPNDFIRDIKEASNGDLWLATEGAGLVRWVRDADRFTPISGRDTKSPVTVVRDIEVASDGRLWLAAANRGFLEADADGQIVHVHPPITNEDVKRIPSWNTVALGSDGSVWVGGDAALAVRPPEKRTLIDASAPLKEAIGRTFEIQDLMLEPDGRLWVATREQGIAYRNSGDKEFRVIEIRDQQANPIRVISLYRTSSGRVWAATNGGLLLLDAERHRFHQIASGDPSDLGLPDNFLVEIYQDRTGLVWLGTKHRGLAIWNPASWTLGPYLRAWHRDTPITAMATTEDGFSWIGTMGQGLVQLDRQGSVSARFNEAHGYPALNESGVMALQIDRRGDLWIGTFAEGLYRYRTSRGVLEQVQNVALGLSGDIGVMALIEGADGFLWVGTFGRGLFRVDPIDNSVVAYTTRNSKLSSNTVSALAESADLTLWAGTADGGINALPRGAADFNTFRSDTEKDSSGSLEVDTIYSLMVDSANRLWAGTAGAGLALMTDSGQFRRWSVPEGFPSNVVYGIRQGNDGNLWISTTNGLVRMNPQSHEFRIFHKEHGLQGEEFTFGAHHAANDGRLFFAGTHGMNVFDPSRVDSGFRAPLVQITEIFKFDEPLRAGSSSTGTAALELSHRDTAISFEYAAMDFTAPEANQYSVMLEGFDQGWSRPSTRNRSTYTNLPPGQYTFRVRAKNSAGLWSEGEQAVNLRVLPAPWATWWAYLLYTAVSAALLMTFLNWRTRHIEHKARMQHLAYYDRLTGLPNRELITGRLGDALTSAGVESSKVACLVVSVHSLRTVTDSFGHPASDEVLRVLSARVVQLFHGLEELGSGAQVGRLGGASFAAFVSGQRLQDSVHRLANSIVEVLGEPVSWQDQRLNLQCSVGIAMAPDHGVEAEAVLARADAAAFSAQQNGGGVAFYDEAMTEKAQQAFELENDLHQALEDDSLELHFQPKFTAAGKLSGFEALLRWNHPKRGWIPPGAFVPLAEQSELIGLIDAWVIRRAGRHLSQWLSDGLMLVPVAVNVSGSNFHSGRILEHLAEVRDREGVDPRWLELEVTESALMRDLDSAAAVLQAIRKAGHAVSLDDFGTGYSSLTYLQRFDVDKVKIDQSFVAEVDTHDNHKAICVAVNALAHSLGLTTVAEGVETESQRMVLQEIGCDEMQGFLLGRPMPESKIRALLVASGQDAVVLED